MGVLISLVAPANASAVPLQIAVNLAPAPFRQGDDQLLHSILLEKPSRPHGAALKPEVVLIEEFASRVFALLSAAEGAR